MNEILCTSTRWLFVILCYINIMIILYYITTPTWVIHIDENDMNMPGQDIYPPGHSELSMWCTLECIVFDFLMFDVIIRRLLRRGERGQTS